MNQEVKKKWLEALRSGEYKQGRGVLRTDDDKYCCLGVLCDLHAKETGSEWVTGERRYLYDYTSGVLGATVMTWAELSENNPFVDTPNGYQRSLSYLNDDGYPFSKIADLIEKEL